MRRAALVFLILTTQALAQRMESRPLDQQPLTRLPWKENPGMPLEGQLQRIYLEPDPEIRYPVLAACLRLAPLDRLDAAFGLCVELEGTQQPERLVGFFMPIWAERDPRAAWKRAEQIFQLQAVEWLSHDDWSSSKIIFRDLTAMRSSSFWVDPYCLAGFVQALARAKLPADEKKVIRDAFAQKWRQIYESEPEERTGVQDGYVAGNVPLIEAFEVPAERISREVRRAVANKHQPALRLLLHRWLAWKPDDAMLVASLAEKLGMATDDLFLLWLQLAPKTLAAWVEAHQNLEDPPFRVMGMLMSGLDGAQRQRWLSGMKERDTDGSFLHDLICAWAVWDPQPALQAALATASAEIIEDAMHRAVYSGFGHLHAGFQAVMGLEFGGLPKPVREEVINSYGVMLMEQWGDVDVGEAARHGLAFMLKTDYAPRENLMKLFSGNDEFSSDSDMIDRTFCALRMWAALKPEEMKAWIATQQDEEMHEALTWLLNNPW